MDKAKPKTDATLDIRRALTILFVPSADRDGRTLGTQDEWKSKALDFFGATYGGATAMPRAEGVWRDDERGGELVRDFPVLVHCYMREAQASDTRLLAKLMEFCRTMGREMKQGEVALIIDGQYHGLTNFS